MPKKNEGNKPKDLEKNIKNNLDELYAEAYDYYIQGAGKIPDLIIGELTPDFVEALELMAKHCEKASGGYCNLFTSLAIKSVLGDNVDIRYHQVQIQDQTDRPAGFNFRGISENVIYNWMEAHEFHGAKSGWQTRTFERPKPYMLDYEENIGTIKKPFLTCYDQIETHHQNVRFALILLLIRRIQLREKSKVILAIPKIDDVIQITALFKSHFFYKYKDSKGASRLPVLALYAIYTCMLKEMGRFNKKELKSLEEHSAADSQTGAIGDIEIIDENGTLFEALEVKHDQVISVAMVDSVKQKIRGSQVDRYYILTTHEQHEPNEDVQKEVENVKKLLGVQLIVNGVIPTIRYYLRMLEKPGSVLPEYTKLLESDKAIGFEHRDIWNQIATGTIK